MQQHLLIDANDTLWENNIYFEQAIEDFINFLNHSSLKPHEVRAVLNEIELTQGYGSASFARSLRECYIHLAEKEIQDEDLERVVYLGEQILHQPMQVIAGVEQTLTIENSGLGIYFGDTIIVEEKNIDTYKRLVTELDLDLENTWMIGNSPRSDINPALEVGLNAVYI